MVSQEYEKPIAKEEVCFSTDRRCKVKDLQTRGHRDKLESAMHRQPVHHVNTAFLGSKSLLQHNPSLKRT